MIAQNHAESLQQLNEVVSELAAAVTASERRYASLARAVRWGALALIVLVATAAYVASDMVKAYAQQVASPWPQVGKEIGGQPPKLLDVMTSLGATREIEGALVKVLQSATAISTVEIEAFLKCVREKGRAPRESSELCYSKAAVEDLGEYFLNSNGELPKRSDPNYQQRLMIGTLMAGGQVVVDAAALIHRLRRDSDFIRTNVNYIGGTRKLLEGIKKELNAMNGMLASIPDMDGEMEIMNRQIGGMTIEMNAMNRQIGVMTGQMGVMSYGVGSTMGRAGSMMPWNMAPW